MKVLFFIVIFSLSSIASGKENPTTITPHKKLIAAAWKASSRISPDPIKLNYVFDDKFIKRFGIEKLKKLFKDLYLQTGSVIKLSTVSFINEYQGDFFFLTEKGYIIPLTIGINQNGKINLFAVREAFKETLSTQDIIEKIKALSYEKKGILIKKLTQIEETLYSFNEDDLFAVGSVFKLFILSYLAENEKRWDRVIKIAKNNKSLLSLVSSKYPDQAPLTIFSLAYHMIAEDDNTATDILIDYIGREKLEAYIKTLTANYALNTPLLKISEVLKIKAKPSIAERYQKASESEKRRLVNSLNNEEIDISNVEFSTPSFIPTIGWFLSPNDICKLMDHLRILNHPFVEAILSANTLLDTKSASYLWAGFKGSKEEGVLSLNWLLQRKDNRYYCISIVINDERKMIDEKEVIKLSRELLDRFAVE